MSIRFSHCHDYRNGRLLFTVAYQDEFGSETHVRYSIVKVNPKEKTPSRKMGREFADKSNNVAVMHKDMFDRFISNKHNHKPTDRMLNFSTLYAMATGKFVDFRNSGKLVGVK